MKKTADLAAEIRATVRVLMQRLLAETPPDGITPSQRSVLLALGERRSWTQTELAARDRVRPQSIGATVSSLEAMGLVARGGQAGDRRCIPIAITAAGKRLLREGREHRNSWLTRALASELTAAERARIAAVLPLLETLVGAE